MADHWRDIATAPKDGSQIIVRFRGSDGELKNSLARWKKTYWRVGVTTSGMKVRVAEPHAAVFALTGERPERLDLDEEDE